MPIVNNVVYVDGVTKVCPPSLEETFELLAVHRGMAWIGLYRPTRAELDAVAKEFNLHELAIEDTVMQHQRPKLERYDHALFTVLRPARYIDSVEAVELGELHVFTGRDFVITVRFAENPDVGRIRRRLESTPELLRLGPEAVLYAILDQVVDEFEPVIAGLENDLFEVEAQVFTGDEGVSRRIYELSREVIELQLSARPMIGMLKALAVGFEKYLVDEELRRYLRDVEDHLIKAVERIDGLRAMLQNILSVNATLVAQRQNEEMQRLTEASYAQSEEVKKISGWAAILFAPTLVGTIYGMNFTHMPELSWTFGYPLAIIMMAAICVVLYVVFKKRGWL